MAAESWDVFISYRSEDLVIAEELHRRLEAAGFRVWLDRARLEPGCKWHDEIEAGCEGSRVILPVLSPHWPASDWCRYETYGGECIIPLLFEGDLGDLLRQVPPLAEWQGVTHDLRAADDAEWERLFAAIRERLAAADPGNAGWQRDLSVSHYKMADVANQAGNAERAVRHLLQCREILRGMKARGMHLDPQAAAVLEQLEGLG